MAADLVRRMLRKDLAIAASLLMAGIVIIALSVHQINAAPSQQIAQATQPLQSSPESEKTVAPAESKPGGVRPTTPAPEPAHPDAEAQKAGAKPALPPAPAEKTAPPINQK